jgi:hypothetical protein
MVFLDTPLPPSLDLKPIRKVVGRPFAPNNPGRPKGTRDKIVRDLKEGTLIAAANIGRDGSGEGGLVGYLEDLALNHKKAFTSLLTKLLPMQPSIIGDGVVRPGVQLNIMSIESGSYLSLEDIERLKTSEMIEHEPSEQLKLEQHPMVETSAPCEAPASASEVQLLTELSASIEALARRVGVCLDDK